MKITGKTTLFVEHHEGAKPFDTYSTTVSHKNEEEMEPQRQQIGGYLKWYYCDRLKQTEKTEEEQEDKCTRKLQQINEQKVKEKECQTNLENLIAKIAAYKTRLESFDQEENKFNDNYGENFTRNILGEYEPGMLSIKEKEYEKTQS